MVNLEGIKEITKRFTLPDYIKPCVALMLHDSFGVGERDTVAFIIATELRRIGKETDVAEKILREWNEKNVPPLRNQDIHNKIKSAYKKEYTYGCNCPKPLISEYCKKINKDFCLYYKDLQQGNKRIGKDIDFIKYRWPGILKPTERDVYYIALPYLEKRRGIKPGDLLFTCHREVSKICGVSLKLTGKALMGLSKTDPPLITYKPGEPYRWRVKGSEVRRIIPIPKPNNSGQDER